MERLRRNSSKWFLYSFVPANQRLNRSEPLEKKDDASNKKGVVGKMGTTTPIEPIATKTNPNVIYRILIDFFIAVLSGIDYHSRQ
jgi:hypothetical protein